MSTSFSCSRHYCTTLPQPDRKRSLASQQIMWRTRVLAEDVAMSHKGPLWVLDYDNTRKRRKEEVSAGSWEACEGLRENYGYLSEMPGCQLDSTMMIMENGWHIVFNGAILSGRVWMWGWWSSAGRCLGLCFFLHFFFYSKAWPSFINHRHKMDKAETTESEPLVVQ